MEIQFSQKVNIITFFWQETDIAVVSLRHSEFGNIFAAHVYGNNLQSDNREDYEFASAYKDVVKLENQGKKELFCI
jgi:hypothetical protein